MTNWWIHGREWWPVATLLLAVVWLGGCSSFERKWEAAAANPAPADDLTGRWAGRWHSEPSGHSGDLRAIVNRNDDGSYHVHYHATYGEGITFTYEYALERMTTEQRDGFHLFTGASDLGWFGTYEHAGHATADRFFANYEASIGDFGTYEMRRVE